MKSITQSWQSRLQSIRSVDFVHCHRLSPKDFTRNRCLSFVKVMAFLLKMAKKSLQIECNFFAELLGEEDSVTKQAMSKARKKIGISAFQQLHADLVKDHYEDNPYHLWKGYRVFGGDGSTMQLPNERDTPLFFGDYFEHVTLARVFQYVELTTDTLVAPCVMPYSISENAIAKITLQDLVDRMRSYGQNKQLYIYDRGFPSHRFAIQHLELNVDFLFRLPLQFNPKIDEIAAQRQEADFEIEIKRPDADYRARVVIRYLSSGQPLILLTSLVSGEFSSEDIVEAYRLRWRSEESYKFQKLLLQLENYTGRTAQTALQDYWSVVFIATAMNLFFLEKEEEIHKEEGGEKTRVNKSVVFAAIREDFLEAFLTGDTSDKIFKKFDKLCRRFRVPVRPNRSYPRLSETSRRRRHIYRKCL
jgi:hypothetical protein